MRIRILAVGTIKEDYIKRGIQFYIEKLRKKWDIELVEVKEEEEPKNPAHIEKVLEIEGERILDKIKKESYVVVLAIEGKEISTDEFSALIKNAIEEGYKDITFVIGGSLGLWHKVKERSDESISFSRMTFPHQIARLILLEQIYRVFS
ncbi:23S rRNA (pseudouridine(1915)-N(3))-methyltransferase RlmH [Caldanaerobacter sp.]|uniref:23S rRNA (pseudouridine(1915)-N(3))-methyltransferase RlmH n=1 Tax=Caldanaerobacter sp. TaxID=2930036 RepID=UPI003C72249C